MAHAIAMGIPPLNEIVGLPAASPAADIALASEQRYQALFDRGSRGDPAAQRELVSLRLAYLNWAYATPEISAAAAAPSDRRS